MMNVEVFNPLNLPFNKGEMSRFSGKSGSFDTFLTKWYISIYDVNVLVI